MWLLGVDHKSMAKAAVAIIMTASLLVTFTARLNAAETELSVSSVPAPTTAPALAADEPVSPSSASMPHIRINRDKRWVDFDAKVVLRDGKWIELLVCTPGSREYESILTTEAKPSHLHLALLILGQTPGSPMTWERKQDDVLPVAPKGPLIEISIHYLKDGKPFEIPAGQWVMDQTLNAPLPSSTWLFAGSKFMAVDGHPVYTADVNGSCISLVNFGDDLLTRPTSQTNHTDGGELSANTPLIPPIGTPVVIRLKPVQLKSPETPVKANDAQDASKDDRKDDKQDDASGTPPALQTQPASASQPAP